MPPDPSSALKSCRDTLQALMEIKRRGLRAGIAIVPGGSPEAYRSLLHMLDTLLVMSVRPGFGSQAFLPSSLQVFDLASLVSSMQAHPAMHWR